ncbi:alpha-2-glucosyltransferase Alg10 [Phaeosphaeriaceae sp. PMI808]|nr:alpha-2-glucosyltransferase Alg10 [Phaeosphaeriaceae sp. PMI808]
MPSLLQSWALPAVLLVVVNLSATWYNVVSNEVKEPYLDEFFHIPQAQKYCNSDYTWDPKITTPPGLYLVAKLFKSLIGCDTNSLRALNVGALCLICPMSYDILRMLRTRTIPGQDKPQHVKVTDKNLPEDDPAVVLDANIALNIALFPPLFFFSALFYTDVMSTLAVLLSYSAFLRMNSAVMNPLGNIYVVFIGLLALLFRQTNIFWVAVFPAGLAVIDALKASSPASQGPKSGTLGEAFQEMWSQGVIHDCSVQDGGPQDYVLLIISVIFAALRKPVLVLRVASPYLVLLGLFAGFVFWNGSVVLGDKSAHTATIHIPQMLYIWPYIAFFSAPIMVEPLLQAAISILPNHAQALQCNKISALKTSGLSKVLVASLFMAGAFLAVHFNTIIHPYTLADNRHYVFYVFRILRQHPIIMYLAVPVYCFCAWLAINAVGLSPNGKPALSKRRDDSRPTNNEAASSPCQVSFITIWLATTTLSVITAPLVEPRYFIVPWIIWRLHVQPLVASLPSKDRLAKSLYDVRLGLETLWSLAINAAVMYIFICWGFTWPSEPGKVQRFLW